MMLMLELFADWRYTWRDVGYGLPFMPLKSEGQELYAIEQHHGKLKRIPRSTRKF